MTPYPSYKPSGIEWLGDIPEHWDWMKIKWFSKVKRGASPRPIDDPKYFDDEGEYSWVRISDVTSSDRYLITTTQRLSELGSSLSVKMNPGDLFLSIAGSAGKPIISKIKCCIHDGFVYFPKLSISSEFLYYIFNIPTIYSGLGKINTQINLNTETVGDIYIPVPSNKEVDDLVSFLDHRTHLIDTLITKKQRLIELLKEYRTAIINQAVTKGLDRNVKMKDSGIDWLVEVPEHWEVKRLKYLGNIKYGLGQPPKTLENGLPLIRATNIERGKINEKDLIYVDPEDIPYDRDPVLKENDIIVVRSGAYTADSAIIPKKFEGSITGYDLVVRVLNDNSVFISYCLLSAYVLINQLFLLRMRAAQPHLNREELGETIIFLPPINEQNQIAQYINAKNTLIENQIEKEQNFIEYLKEYRTALISEVVTGKVDVREETKVE